MDNRDAIAQAMMQNGQMPGHQYGAPTPPPSLPMPPGGTGGGMVTPSDPMQSFTTVSPQIALGFTAQPTGSLAGSGAPMAGKGTTVQPPNPTGK